MRSPRMAPPVNGELGSTAITATAWSRDRRSATRLSASVDLPVPGAPVRPTTRAGLTVPPSDSRRCRTDGSRCSTIVIALARPRTLPARNSATRSRRGVPPLRASLEEAVEEVSPDLDRLCTRRSRLRGGPGSTPRSRLRGDPGCGPLHPHCVGAPFPGPSPTSRNLRFREDPGSPTPRNLRFREDPGSPTPRNLRFREDPGSPLLACVRHEYACSGVPHPTKPTGFAGTPSRRTGRIRTTAGYPARRGWVAALDLAAPFLNSLLRAPGPVPVEVGAHDHYEPFGLFAGRRHEARSHPRRRWRGGLDMSATEEVL